MSGGKETPRQKMIGMMYLVLTALLALNVSKSILDAFVAIEENTQKANIVQVERGHVLIAEVKSELGSTPNDDENKIKREKLKFVLEQMNKVDNETGNMIEKIDDLKLLILQKSGENIESINNNSEESILWSKYNSSKDKVLPARMHLMAVQAKDQYDVPMHEIIGDDITNPSGEGIKIWKDLLKFRKSIVELTGAYEWNGKKYSVKTSEINKYKDNKELTKRVSEMLIASKTNHTDDDAVLSELYILLTKLEKNEVHGTKDVHWIGSTFDHSPLVAAIASLSSLQQDILAARALSLAHWKSKVSVGEFSFNKIMALPYGPVVVNEGDSVDIQVMMAAFNSDNQPLVTVDNELGDVIYPGNGQGVVKFKAGGSTMTLTGTVSIKNKSGIAKTERWEHTVQIMKPQGSIELTELNMLYRGYKNKVVPTASGFPETVLKGTSNLQITRTSEGYDIKPTGRGAQAKLMVYGKTNEGDLVLLKTVNYRVSNLPNPEIFWGSSKDGGRVNSSRTLFAKYTPDIPLDARFTVVNWECTSSNMRGAPPVGTGQSFAGASALINAARAGTGITMRVTIKDPAGLQRTITGFWTK